MTDKARSYGKTGAGGYTASILPDGRVTTSVENNSPLVFPSVRAAYDFHRPYAADSHADWNVCYSLEDHLKDA